jgi:hypothetical protein
MARGGWVERLLEEVRREFFGLPVYVGVEDGYVKKTAPMDQRQFRRYLETCRRLGFRFDRRGRGGSSRWRSYSHLQRYKRASTFNTDLHRLNTLHGQTGGGGSRLSVPPQERGAFPTHARPNAA